MEAGGGGGAAVETCLLRGFGARVGCGCWVGGVRRYAEGLAGVV